MCFDADRYAAACREVQSAAPCSSGEIITVLVGQVPDPDKLEIVAKAAKQRNATLLVTGSKRTAAEDWHEVKKAFKGVNATFYWANSKNPREAVVENPYYLFLARADKIVTIDSGSMAAEAAHTGKPVYAERSTIIRYSLEFNVLPLTQRTTWKEKALPKLDIAGDMARDVVRMYGRFLRAHRGRLSGPWVQNVLTPEAAIQV